MSITLPRLRCSVCLEGKGFFYILEVFSDCGTGVAGSLDTMAVGFTTNTSIDAIHRCASFCTTNLVDLI